MYSFYKKREIDFVFFEVLRHFQISVDHFYIALKYRITETDLFWL